MTTLSHHDHSATPAFANSLVIALLGWPNAGKSTLVNNWLAAPVMMTSHKRYSTRRPSMVWLPEFLHRYPQQPEQEPADFSSNALAPAPALNPQKIQGVALIDTPGLLATSNPFEQAMHRQLLACLTMVDHILIVWDSSAPVTARKKIISWLSTCLDKNRQNQRLQVLLAINKADRVPRSDLLQQARDLHDWLIPTRTYMISALKDNGCDRILRDLWQLPQVRPTPELGLPFPTLTLAENLAEITRQAAWRLLHQEVPYSLMVKTVEISKRKDASWQIQQVIITNEQRHLAIIVGKAGSKLAAIGSSARVMLAKRLDQPVHLNLTVQFDENWQLTAFAPVNDQ